MSTPPIRPGGASMTSPRPGTGPHRTLPSRAEVTERGAVLEREVVAALRAEQPELGEFTARRPARDRNSGEEVAGIGTLVHVGELLAGDGAPDPGRVATRRLLSAADAAAARHGMTGLRTTVCEGVLQARWSREDGDELELVIGVRVAVRVISAPFLPRSR